MPKENKNGDVTKEISEIIKAYTKTVNEEIKGLPPFKKVEIITQYIEDGNFQPSEINYFLAQLHLTQNEREQARIAQNRENVSKKPSEVIEGFAEIVNEEIKGLPPFKKVEIITQYIEDWNFQPSEINDFLAQLPLTQNECEQIRSVQNRENVHKKPLEVIEGFAEIANEEIKDVPSWEKVDIVKQYVKDWEIQLSEINDFLAHLHLTQNEREQARIAQNRENVHKKPLEVIEGFAEIANEEIKDVPSWEKVDIVKRYVKDWEIQPSEINDFLAHLHLTQDECEQVRIAQNRAVKPEIAPKPIRKAPKPPQVQNAGLGQPQSLKNLVDRTLQGKVLEQNNAKSKNCSRRMDPYQRS